MDLGIQGKTAVVSGSTAGIGLAIATAFAQEGTTVVVNGRTQMRVDQAIQSIQKTVPKASLKGVAADLGTAEGAAILFKAVPQTDILVNNLGIFEPKPFEKIPDEDWKRFFDVNVLSGVRLSRQYLPGMKQKNWGRIIFISSESGVNIPSEMIHYGMTKTAQLAVARGLAETTVGTGVTVNSVLPGPTNSEGVSGFVDDLARTQNKDRAQVEKDFFKTMRPSSLIQRFASTEEVAAMVVYAASAKASATNGAALRVEGGLLRGIV